MEFHFLTACEAGSPRSRCSAVSFQRGPSPRLTDCRLPGGPWTALSGCTCVREKASGASFTRSLSLSGLTTSCNIRYFLGGSFSKYNHAGDEGFKTGVWGWGTHTQSVPLFISFLCVIPILSGGPGPTCRTAPRLRAAGLSHHLWLLSHTRAHRPLPRGCERCVVQGLGKEIPEKTAEECELYVWEGRRCRWLNSVLHRGREDAQTSDQLFSSAAGGWSERRGLSYSTAEVWVRQNGHQSASWLWGLRDGKIGNKGSWAPKSYKD